MAAFSIVNFPLPTPTPPHLSQTNLFLPSPPLPRNHRLISLVTKSRRSNLHLFRVKDNPQFRALAEAQAEPIVESESAVSEEEEVSDTRLLIQNVPWTSTVDDVRPLLEKYGTVVDIELSMYNKTRSRGLAFATMASHEEAAAALNGLDSTEFEGRVLKINWAKPKKPKPPPPQPKPQPIHNLFVANLNFQARAKDLKEFFNAENGNVVSAEVVFRNNPRRSSGYGFVSFNTKADADAALVAFDGKEFMGRSIRVARSKRFLRQETKATIESETNATIESETKATIESESTEET